MEITGYLKVIVIIFAVAIPISVVFLVYRIVFSGLDSVRSSRRAVNTDEETTDSEKMLGSKQTEFEAEKLNANTDKP